MTGFRTGVSASIVAGLVCALLGAPACGTDAQGIGDCRNIEEARCAAAAHCGVVDDVGSCQRFYRDQCLHGTTTASPGGPSVNFCVEAIRAAGDCAADDSLCVAPVTPANACKLILSPELLHDCRFLSPTPGPEGEGGAPGATGGVPGTTAGAGGVPTTDPGEGEGGTPSAGGVSAG